MSRDFLSMNDLSPPETYRLLDLASVIKATPSDYARKLEGLSVAMVFEKPSTRTRVSFEVAVRACGGNASVLSGGELQLGRGETIEDTGRVLSRYVDAIIVRTFEQERLEALASASDAPVINALSDFEHPCQVLADLLTIQEKKGRLEGLLLAYLGDGNNVANSLLLGGAMMGLHVRAATPPGFEPIPQVVERAGEIARMTNGSVEVMNDPVKATEGADVLYTDVWASMGQEEEADERSLVFPPYQLDQAAVERAGDDVIVMHCLPAHRGEEITDEVIDGPHSIVWDQAENRLHTAKALLLWVFGIE
ncbi:MAG: ornithine carbamoyltransferase [Actinomycetota bacterium]